MPPSARKSSVGAARRSIAKPHLPYRGDDPTVGKKTGLVVRPIPRGSDGFEPFDQLLEQNKPPSPKKRKKKSVPQQDEEEEEEDVDGEMSMDVDSPIQNYANARQPNTPRISRPISRTSEVDFDQVPSPAQRPQKSLLAGPSRLTQSAQELLDQDEDEYERDDDDDDDFGGGFNDYAPQEDSPQQVSFTEMDTRQDDDDEENESPVASPKNKGKGRAVQDDADDMEDDIMRGMDDVDMEPASDEEPAQPSPPRKSKEKPKPRSPIRSKLQKENRDVPEGVRRSHRVTYPPLEWWRLEKVVFGRDPASGPILVPHIKEIIRIPKEPVVPLGKKGRARRRTTPAPAGKVVEKVIEKIVEVPVEDTNPEEGWDDETETQAVVKDYVTKKDVTRRVAFTAKMFAPSPAANNEWLYQKIFGDGDFIASGQMVIPPKGRKPSKPTKDNTFIFLVLEGAVNLKVYETSLIVASGGMFMIPRGNTYFIENIADRDAKLFFTQARKMRDDELDDEDARRVSATGLTPQPVRAVSVAVNGTARVKDLKRGMSSNV
ncbi:Mif2/CENP-C like-domain-containing protein [Mycena crocata]|nr:Mif2/CENP-C like-domain-containing protein [Mycena crocata]